MDTRFQLFSVLVDTTQRRGTRTTTSCHFASPPAPSPSAMPFCRGSARHTLCRAALLALIGSQLCLSTSQGVLAGRRLELCEPKDEEDTSVTMCQDWCSTPEHCSYCKVCKRRSLISAPSVPWLPGMPHALSPSCSQPTSLPCCCVSLETQCRGCHGLCSTCKASSTDDVNYEGCESWCVRAIAIVIPSRSS